MRQITLLIPFLLIFSGCANSPGETTAYKTLGSIGYTVDGAMTAYADAVAAGQVTDSEQAKVRALFGRYRTLYGSAVRAARNDLSTLAPDEIAVIAAELTTLVLGFTS